MGSLPPTVFETAAYSNSATQALPATSQPLGGLTRNHFYAMATGLADLVPRQGVEP